MNPAREVPAGAAPDAADVAALRAGLVDDIAARHELPEAIELALRAVPRDRFLPGVDPAQAYADQAVTIKDNPDGGLPLSCASVPSVVAMMLSQLAPRPGDWVLEIGAGTGYNAALLDHLVGPTGRVTTVDIDPDVAAHARACLDRTGRGHVTVVHGDGLLGAPDGAPYDRMIATVGMWDIPPAWWAQLVDGGRMVVPLRWRGQTRSVALTRRGDELVCDDMALCGFVPVIGQDGEHTTALADGAVFLHHDQDQTVDADRLTAALRAASVEVWSTAVVDGQESFDGIWLRAGVEDPSACRIQVSDRAIADGLHRPIIPVRSPAVTRDDSLAYLIKRPDTTAGTSRFQLGASGYGPDGQAAARALVGIIEAWSIDRHASPKLSIVPGHMTTPSPPPARVVQKVHTRLELSFVSHML